MPDTVDSMPVSIRLPTDLLETLDKVAAALDRPRSWVILHAIRAYLQEEGAEIIDTAEGLAQVDRGEGVGAEDTFAAIEAALNKAALKSPRSRR